MGLAWNYPVTRESCVYTERDRDYILLLVFQGFNVSNRHCIIFAYSATTPSSRLSCDTTATHDAVESPWTLWGCDENKEGRSGDTKGATGSTPTATILNILRLDVKLILNPFIQRRRQASLPRPGPKRMVDAVRLQWLQKRRDRNWKNALGTYIVN